MSDDLIVTDAAVDIVARRFAERLVADIRENPRVLHVIEVAVLPHWTGISEIVLSALDVSKNAVYVKKDGREVLLKSGTRVIILSSATMDRDLAGVREPRVHVWSHSSGIPKIRNLKLRMRRERKRQEEKACDDAEDPNKAS